MLAARFMTSILIILGCSGHLAPFEVVKNVLSFGKILLCEKLSCWQVRLTESTYVLTCSAFFP